ncbi:MAG: DsrE/DsrF/DrsH-like family protein [Gammaproteobacteria bacterium]|nr:DsrE/DsrF/DrsH-like family protein [Gammaproteobacteria bacterium]MCW8987712.1 DsrE/DsrF/DrsH-like family protein [Gammaproteobacteria bacterium]MCW9031850.1 DsrE/DsrF/DrsH-like family protein [Gammaproteobacteria bacterium]
MTDKTEIESDKNQATILLVSGEMDKAILAFEIAAAMAAMGTKVNMWFVLYGVNCLKKPRSIFSWRKWFPKKAKAGHGRNPDTDSGLQRIIQVLNHDGASKVPLSQINYFGAGPLIFNSVMKKKGIASLETLIRESEALGVNFRICQICIDALALNVEEDLIVNAEVLGVSTYTLEVKNSHYNAVF